MSASEACIGIDIGTSALKGVAVSPDGRLLAEASAEYPVMVGPGGASEQDPDHWWEAAQAVLAELDDEDKTLAIGLSGQMHGLVLLDARKRPVRPAILWNDARPGAEAAELERSVGGGEAALAIAGTRAMAGLTAPKLRWLARHEPESLERARHIVLPKDEVRRRLCGEIATDVGDASGTFLFDVGARDWSPELIAAAELEHSLLPPVGESAELAGETPAGVPVALGSGDQLCGAVGVGAVSEGVGSLVVGTSGVVLVPRDSAVPAADSAAWTHTFCHALPDRWCRMGVSLSSGGALRWLASTLAPGESLGGLLELAAAIPAATGPQFLPYLSGERTPVGRADARGAIVGLGLEHGRGDLVRSVMEGVAYALRDCLDAVLEGKEDGSIEFHASGGGAASELWLKILASVLGRPLRVSDSVAGAAFGAAILGGVAAGVWSGVEEAPLPAFSRSVEPEPSWIEPYAEGLERHRELREVLVELNAS